MFAIVDIETTGGYAQNHRIIEVAVVLWDGQQVQDRFQSLVNPGRSIPLNITALTGIADDDVADAPSFAEVASKILELTADRIFVAHQVNFDYAFMRVEMQEAGFSFQRKKLCTLRLSRKMIPNLSSYSLGRLCDAVGITFESRHRALSDAEAATALLAHLHQIDSDNYIEHALNRQSREALLPPNLPREHFTELPEKAGVYFFKDSKGKIVYVGKAKRLKTRVTSHFSGTAQTWQKQQFMRHIHSIDHELTGNELVALLLESFAIKKYWPPYNRAQKKPGLPLGLLMYEDRGGFLRLGIQKIRARDQVLLAFSTMLDARNFLWGLTARFQLCPKLCGLQTGPGPCADVEAGVCDGPCCGKQTAAVYNQRVEAALNDLKDASQSIAIVGAGRKKDEQSVVLVEAGKYCGFGFVQKADFAADLNAIKDIITPYPDSPDARSIILSHLRRNRTDQVLEL